MSFAKLIKRIKCKKKQKNKRQKSSWMNDLIAESGPTKIGKCVIKMSVIEHTYYITFKHIVTNIYMYLFR